jgi:hypothetical protein
MEVKLGGVTASVAEPLIVPDVAVMEALPWVKVVASPEVLTVATAVAEDAQVAVEVRFCVVPSV